MKKILKIVGLFLFLFVGNTSISMAQQSFKYAIEGEDVSFDLIEIFYDGKGEDKIVQIWVDDPLFGRKDITTISRYVLLCVQREQAGPYKFSIRRQNGNMEMWIINLIVLIAEPYAYLNGESDSRCQCSKQLDLYFKETV